MKPISLTNEKKEENQNNQKMISFTEKLLETMSIIGFITVLTPGKISKAEISFESGIFKLYF